MRKLISSIVLVGTALLMLLPVQPVQPVQRVRAQTNAVYYTVRYACTGPTMLQNLTERPSRDINRRSMPCDLHECSCGPDKAIEA
jgi:hypothetical protein